MENIYEPSSSDRVKNLERELDREIKDLQSEIEDGGFLDRVKDAPESFSSFSLPMDMDYFAAQKKRTLETYLRVREAKPLYSHYDVMEEEVASVEDGEYTVTSVALLLHDFFVKRVKELMLLQHLHMLRWTRFCQHTKVIEGMYPEYSKRMNEIIVEYRDALDRAHRLSALHRAFMSGKSMPISVVKNDDLVIFARWLVCHFHAVKKIHAFLQVIQWLPQSYTKLDPIYEDMKYRKGGGDDPGESVKLKEIVSKPSPSRLPTASSTAAAEDLKSTSSDFLSLISSDCRFNTDQNLVKALRPIRTVAVWRRKAVLSRERGMLRKFRPLLTLNLTDIAVMLDSLLVRYEVGMTCAQIRTASDETDMFNLVLHKFKEVHFAQEEKRSFPVYGVGTDSGSHELEGTGIVYKRESNWLKYVEIRPDVDGKQLITMTKLRQKCHRDELLWAQSRIVHVEDSDKVVVVLKTHVKQTEEILSQRQTSATTATPPPPPTLHASKTSTKDVWKRIFETPVSSWYREEDMVDFDTKVRCNDVGITEGKALNDAALKLGLEGEEVDTLPASCNGAVLSLTLLRHLRIKDFRHKCLCILNYFRSVERTLTIDDVGLSVRDDDIMSPMPQYVSHDPDLRGIGSHHYVHNTPADYAVHLNNHQQASEVVNHDNFYSTNQGNVYVQDEQGIYIMYDSALKDFRALEEELLMIGSHFIKKSSDRISERERNKAFDENEFDVNAYGSRMVDRFGVLLDLWTNEALYQESKQKLLDCYFESYHHVVSANERRKLTQLITTLIYKRPRFYLDDEYFVTSYQAEIKLLTLYYDLIKALIDDQMQDQRAYVEKLHRGDRKGLGIPFSIVPLHKIAVNNSTPALNSVFMLEFHPSLAIITAVPDALRNALREMVHVHPPKSAIEEISLETYFLEMCLDKWVGKPQLGEKFGEKVCKELFADVLVEDPLLVSAIGDSLNPLKAIRGRSPTQDEVGKMMEVWIRLFDTVTLRNRLVLAAHETNIVSGLYQSNALGLGYERGHAFVRPTPFERAKSGVVVVKEACKGLTEDDKVDRYIPATSQLAIAELDDKHMIFQSFKTREGVTSNMEKDSIDKLKLMLLVEISKKNLFTALLHQLSNTRNTLRSTEVLNIIAVAPNEASRSTMLAQVENRLKSVFVSVQREKMFLRDNMLVQYAETVEKKNLHRSEDFLKLKKELIRNYCYCLNKVSSQHALRGQILGLHHSLRQMLSRFPHTRDNYFMLGEERDKKKEVADQLQPDPHKLTKRPERVLSSDGSQVLNLWFVPHFTEVLTMYEQLPEEKTIVILKIFLQLTSYLHDICQYLCSYACSGSSHVRDDHSGHGGADSADWGGAEGIGSELGEIQRQIDQLEHRDDPEEVCAFLRYKRDVMFLEYNITISHTVPARFLRDGNISAFQNITSCQHLIMLGNHCNVHTTNFNLTLPESLIPSSPNARELFPWRSFVCRHGYVTGCYGNIYHMASDMQTPLIGLRDVDKRKVHGEMLGVSLLLEDVLTDGVPFIPPADEKSSRRGSSAARRMSVKSERESRTQRSVLRPRKASTVVAESEPELHLKNFTLRKSPLEALKLCRNFLLIWSQLERLKKIWGCRRMRETRIDSTKQYKSFFHWYRTEVHQQVLKRFVSDHPISMDTEEGEEGGGGGGGGEGGDDGDLPSNVTTFELKIHLSTRLLENIEVFIIQDCIRRVSREHTMVVAERARSDNMLPTDLWKNPNMKENLTLPRPQLVENFLHNLDIPMHVVDGNDDVITLPCAHLDACMMKLAQACTEREKTMYLTYATFYENLLRQQNQVLYTKEEEIKHLNDVIALNRNDTAVQVNCGLADKSFDLLIEVTALRAKLHDAQNLLAEREEVLEREIKATYNNLVLDLFNNALHMDLRFQKFRLKLHDDVLQKINDARHYAVDKWKAEQAKNSRRGSVGGIVESESAIRLITADKLRNSQAENKHLVEMLIKLKLFNRWKAFKNENHFKTELHYAQDSTNRTLREKYQESSVHREKEQLVQEQMKELRDVLKNLERECDHLRKQLDKEQKVQAHKAHQQLHEEQSVRYLRNAKNSNWEKLMDDLEQKEHQLQTLKDTTTNESRRSLQSASDLKRQLRASKQQAQDERKLKLDAYLRVDDLQRQVAELETQMSALMSREKTATSYHESCLPLVGGRVSPQRAKVRSQSQAGLGSNRPKSCGPLVNRPKSGTRPMLSRGKSEMYVSGTNWVPYT